MNVKKYRAPPMDSTFIGPQISEYINDNISFSRGGQFKWLCVNFILCASFAVYFACLGRKFHSEYYIVIFHIL